LGGVVDPTTSNRVVKRRHPGGPIWEREEKKGKRRLYRKSSEKVWKKEGKR